MRGPCANPVRPPKAQLAALLCGALLALLDAEPAATAEHEIGTRAARWNPLVLFIQPGDSVVWRGMEGHETEVVEGMAPAGAMPWRSDLDEEGFTVTFDVVGAYIYTCLTHMNAGMVGAIVVGDVSPDEVVKLEAAMADIEIGRNFVQSLLGRLRRELVRRSTP